MPEYKSLALSSASVENLSRHEMLQWVNSTLSSKYNKIEELCSGVAYCQLMEMLFPNCIGIKKVKMTAKLEHECSYNLKLFQSAFSKMKFEKTVPIDRLIKGRFQDNFEFLQWFKKFYDMHSGDKENSLSPNKLNVGGRPMRKSISTSNLKTTGTSSTGTVKKTPTSAKSSKEMRAKSTSTSHLTPRTSQPSRPVSPSSLEVLTETVNQLRENIGTTEQERNYYFNKLHQIEILCTESQKKNEHHEWTTKVLETLYKTDDTAVPNF